MKKIIIKPGCITCGTCAFLAPNVFEVTDISHVKTTADLEKNKEQIKDAMQQCPMQVITYEE
ncbi:MAG: ferredoxin [Candidatus Babeliales bacterium]